jgi:DNA-binding NtrC family response regulator
MSQQILIVDDTIPALGALAELLQRAGYDVLTAASFESARRLLDTENPDLLIVDIRLGAYNGLQLAVRERIEHPNRPVIIMTGYPDPTLEAEARRNGAEFVEKPIRADDLFSMVKRMLARHQPDLS